MNLPSDHAHVLERITRSVALDDRFHGLAAGGSLLTGDLDQYSDLDLVVVVADEHHSAVMAHRHEIAAEWMPLLAAFTGEHVGEPRLLICLCADPLLHVDLKFVTGDELSQRIEDPLVIWQRGDAVSRSIAKTDPSPLTIDPQWVEDRFWIWVHYAATKLGRGELFELLEFLGFLRGQVLAPLALHVRGLSPRGVRRLEQHLPDLVPDLAATVSLHDRDGCATATRQCVDLYRVLRDQLPVPLRRGTEVEEVSVRYLDSIIGGSAPSSAASPARVHDNR
jgi:hypothetical protein